MEEEGRARSHYELDKNGANFHTLAVKKFIRAAAGNAMGDPLDVRPPHVLWLTVRYMRDCIIDLDRCPKGTSFYQYEGQRYKPDADYSKVQHAFTDIYSFIKDRMRQVSQDLSFYKNIVQTQESVYCMETMIRILVVSYH